MYKTPGGQRFRNEGINRTYDAIFRLGVPKMSKIFKVDNDTVIKCAHAGVPFACQYHFPSCDGTQSEYKERKICRETCLNFIHICGRIWDVIAKLFVFKHPDPESKKLLHCELQPYRNAGDSPECWYSDFKESTGNEIMKSVLSACIVFEQHS